MALYISTKTYTHAEGLSCCYRQWRAGTDSRLHGAMLSFKLVFECHHVDDHGWTIDFGLLDQIRSYIKRQFERTTIVSEDDPCLSTFQELSTAGACDLRLMSAVSCEKFAELVFGYAKQWMTDEGLLTRVTIRSVECSEHDGNTAMYIE
jgi:6-pyruvoyltetrahydropterin/6-carboxytetrahydropterin synthase